jgi:hypothetical protein
LSLTIRRTNDDVIGNLINARPVKAAHSPTDLTKSTRPVHVAPVGEDLDGHDSGLVVDPIDHAVRTSAGRPPAGELEPERLAHAPWFLGECSIDELHDGKSDLARQ